MRRVLLASQCVSKGAPDYKDDHAMKNYIIDCQGVISAYPRVSPWEPQDQWVGCDPTRVNFMLGKEELFVELQRPYLSRMEFW